MNIQDIANELGAAQIQVPVSGIPETFPKRSENFGNVPENFGNSAGTKNVPSQEKPGVPDFPASAWHAPIGDSDSFEPCPPGGHQARVISLVNLGWQESVYGVAQKILFMFEILDATRDDGFPYIVTKQYTLSMHEKAALRKALDGWRGKAMTDDEARKFDLSKLLGQYCQLQIQHKESSSGRMYAGIAGIFSLNQAQVTNPGTRDLLLYDAETGDPRVLETLPEWVQKICSERVPAKEAHQMRAKLKTAGGKVPF